MKRLEELLQSEFEKVEFKFREGNGKPYQKIEFKGYLVSTRYTELANDCEAVFLTPKGHFLHYFIDDETEIGLYSIYTNFESFRADNEIDEDLYIEVAYEVGFEEEILTRVLDI